ncbi:MAG TPA: serine hydrolase [Steroidobacteraceae bacterium]
MKKLGLLAVVAVIAAIAFVMFRSGESAPERIVVKLVPGPPQPKVTPAEAGIDMAAIQAAVDYAGKRNTSALLIGQGGHLVFEKYWGDGTLDTPLSASQFGRVLVPLLVGSAMNDRLIISLDEPVSNYLPEYADTPAGKATLRDHLGQRVEGSMPGSWEMLALVLERVTKQSFDVLVTERLWKPLEAGEFSMERNGDNEVRKGAAKAGCCVVARIGDWMRIGEMLANDGVFEGNQFAPPRYVTLMQKPTHNLSRLGLGMNVGGDFAADVAWLADGTQRLWVVPSLRLVILRVGDAPDEADGWDEVMIPDSIIRGTSGWQPRSVGEGLDPKKFAPH